jgi:predicted DsbA family dithiol-disulfide isomerase
MADPVTIQVVSDFVCPWCFVGKRRLEKALAERPELEARVEWLPFQLSPDMPPEGKLRKTHYEDIFGVERAAVIMGSMRDTGKDEGIDFGSSETAMSPNTLAAHCLLYWAQSDPAVDANDVAEKLFAAHHEACEDIGSIDVLVDIARQSGMDAVSVRQQLEQHQDESVVNEMMQQVRASQVTGVPFFVLDGQYALSGAQPVDILLNALDDLGKDAPAGAS